tara:strand:- start:2533 stop:3468 length:936 start_codon:yes stop_codon:yes gene_type:complete
VSIIFDKIKPWILAARPKTLFAALAPIIIGLSISFHIFNTQVNWLVAFIIVITSILIQIGSNFANDAYDYIKGTDDKNIRKGPSRMAEEGLLTPESILNMMYFIFIISVILGYYLVQIGGWPIIIIGLLGIFFAIIYTGGPFPLGYNGLGDIAVFIFFGLVATFGTVYLQSQSIKYPFNISDYIIEILIASCAIGFLNTSILVVNNLRDFESDKLSGKNTLVVIFGERFGCYQYSILITLSFIAFILVGILFENYWLIGMMSLSFFLSIYLISKVFKYKITNLNILLEKTAKFVFLNSVLFATSFYINILT